MSVVFLGFPTFYLENFKPVGKLREQCRERMYLSWRPATFALSVCIHKDFSELLESEL